MNFPTTESYHDRISHKNNKQVGRKERETDFSLCGIIILGHKLLEGQ